MSDKSMGKASEQQMKASDWDRFHAMSDEEIDTSDIPELEINDQFWEQAKIVIPVDKQAISLRVDKDILEWFKQQSKQKGMKGYQSFI